MLTGPQSYTLACAAIATLLTIAVPLQSEAQSNAVDDAEMGVVADVDECSGNVPECSTIRTPIISVKAGQEQRIKVMCASGLFFWNWTAQATSQLIITRWSELAPAYRVVPSTRPVLDDQKRPIGSIFTLDEQSGTRNGRAQISIGCSPEDPTNKIVARRNSYSVNPAVIR